MSRKMRLKLEEMGFMDKTKVHYMKFSDLKTFKKQINKIILLLPPALGLRIFLYNELYPCWTYMKGTHSANIWVSDSWM